MSSSENARRAHRLTKFYPTAWRQRYGEEFEAHMEQDIEETPHSLSRSLNVMMKGFGTHAKNLTWRILLLEPSQGKLRNSRVLPTVLVLGFALSIALRGSNVGTPWPALILFGVLYALFLFGYVYDTRKIRTVGPSKRFSMDRNIMTGIIILNSGVILLQNAIGHRTLVLYTVLVLDVVLFSVRFGWIRRKREPVRNPLIPVVQGKTKS